MRFSSSCTLALAAVLFTGCDTLSGPSIDFTSPRIVGKAIDATTGEPIKGARVGRAIYTWRGPGGEFRKGAEDLLLQETYTRTDAQGEFNLPSRRSALLFRFGDYSLNMKLVLQKSGYTHWQTNFPMAALSTNAPGPEPRIEPVTIPLVHR